jgi:hypothetical protein
LNQQDIIDVANSDTPFLNSTVAFVLDMVDIGVPLCALGYSLADGFVNMEDLLTAFDVGYENVTNYGELIGDLDDLRTTTSSLSSNATLVDLEITDVETKAATNTYGELNDIAITFTDQLSDFGFVQYVQNANYVVNALYYTFVGIEALSHVMESTTQLQADLAALDYLAANASLLNAENSLSDAVGNLTLAESYMDDAVNIGGMTQLSTSLAAISAILSGLVGIQINIDNLQTLMADPVANATAINDEITLLLANLLDINSDLQGITSQ